MATARWGTPAPVSQRIGADPHGFDFFQAVRLLERIQRERRASDGPPDGTRSSDTEAVRFQASSSLSFAAGSIASLGTGDAVPDEEQGQAAPAQMQVAFLGLTGSGGVLPQHYTELLIRRLRTRDFALRDFLDLFNHRTVSMFYDAWCKYRVPVNWERARLDQDADDMFPQSLRCIVGVGTPHLQQRLAVPDDTLLFYAGYMARQPRSAIALQAMLADYLQLPVTVEQFQGRWIALDRGECSFLPGPQFPGGQYAQLGVDAIAGARVWDVRSKFRLRIGPIGYDQFLQLMPDGSTLQRASSRRGTSILTRTG